MFFEVFNQVILFTQLKVVSKVVHFLMRQQSLLIYLIETILLAPDHVPVFIACLFITSILKGLIDAVREVSSVPDFGSFDITQGITFGNDSQA